MSTVPCWLLGALEDIGVQEVPGDEAHPRILEYQQSTGKWSRDEVPWCGSAVETWLTEQAYEGLGRPGASARSWLKWGVKADPQLGAVTVIRRRKKGPDSSTGSSTGHHVGLYLNHSRGGVALLSGNASNRVGVDVYSRQLYDVLGFRMPE